MSGYIWLLIPIMVLVFAVGSYIIIHDSSVSAKALADSFSCDRKDAWLKVEGKKISKNLFTNEMQKSFDEKCVWECTQDEFNCKLTERNEQQLQGSVEHE